MANNEDIMVMINGSHSGFYVSQKAIDEYIKETGKSMKFNEYHIYDVTDRIDQIMCQIVKKLGKVAMASNTNICIYSIKKKYKDFIYIHEYDGQESLDIRFNDYKRSFKVSQIASLLQLSIDDKTKLHRIKNITSESDEKPILVYGDEYHSRYFTELRQVKI